MVMTTMTTVMTVMMMMTHHHHFQTKHQTNAKCHRTVEYRDQTATERPARPRVSAPAICVNTRSYVFVFSQQEGQHLHLYEVGSQPIDHLQV